MSVMSEDNNIKLLFWLLMFNDKYNPRSLL